MRRGMRIINKVWGGLSLLISISLFCIGYSSWLTNPSILKANITTSIGEIEEYNFSTSCNYVIGSEKGFNYYVFENQRYYTSTTFSLRLRVNPNLVKKLFSGSTIKINFGLKYSYLTDSNINLFQKDNGIIEPPRYYKCILENSGNRVILSDSLVSSSNSFTNGNTIYTLKGDVVLYDENEPSLYSISKEYQKGDEYLFFDIIFEFIDINLSTNTIFPEINFNFITNVPGANL